MESSKSETSLFNKRNIQVPSECLAAPECVHDSPGSSASPTHTQANSPRSYPGLLDQAGVLLKLCGMRPKNQVTRTPTNGVCPENQVTWTHFGSAGSAQTGHVHGPPLAPTLGGTWVGWEVSGQG